MKPCFPRIVGNGASPFSSAYGRDGFNWHCDCGARGRRRWLERGKAWGGWLAHARRTSNQDTKRDFSDRMRDQ